MRKYNSSSNFVAPQAPPEYDPIMEHSLSQNLERDVLVPLLQNLAGALGVFVSIVAVQFWRIDFAGHSATLESVTLGAAYWAGGAFGVACAIRAFRDELQVLAHHWARGWAEGRTNQDLAWLESEVERLQVENRQLSAANAQMVRHVRTVPVQQEAREAPLSPLPELYTDELRDALALCRFQDAHGKISRDAVIAASVMDRPRWEAAKRLLQDAGVTIENGVIGESPAVAMSQVRTFVDKLRNSPDNFTLPFERE